MYGAQMTHNCSFSVSYLFFIYCQYTKLHHASSYLVCAETLVSKWTFPYTRHGRGAKLSERSTKGITSGKTTVIALCGFRPSDRVSTDT